LLTHQRESVEKDVEDGKASLRKKSDRPSREKKSLSVEKAPHKIASGNLVIVIFFCFLSIGIHFVEKKLEKKKAHSVGKRDSHSVTCLIDVKVGSDWFAFVWFVNSSKFTL
jgi:hypothetical protein